MPRRHLSLRLAAGLVATLTVAGVATMVAPSTAFAAAANASGPLAYSGDAYAASIQNLRILGSAPLNTVIGDTGQLPAAGGDLKTGAENDPLLGNLASLSVIGGETSGVSGTASSHETVAGLTLLDLSNVPTSLLNGTPLGNLLGGLLGPLLGGACPAAGSTSSSGGGGLLGGLLGGGLLGGLLGGASPPSTSGGGLLGLGNLLNLGSTLGSTTCASNGSPLSSLLGGILPSVLGVGLVQSSAQASTDGTHAEAATVAQLEVLGSSVPISLNPNTTVGPILGITVTVNHQAFDVPTNTSTADALVINLDPNGPLGGLISGTITLSHSTAGTSGSLCTSITITSLSPNTGATAGGTAVKILGTGFNSQTGAVSANFGSTPATSVVKVSDTEIDAVSPAGTGVVPVSVTEGTCTSAPSKFGYVAPMTRVGGSDRIATAIAVAQRQFVTAGSAGAVVIARDDDFPDALGAVPLGAAKHAPLLLTEPPSLRANGLDPRNVPEIQQVLPAGGTVYLLGGYAALSQSIDAQLTSLGFHPVRLAGATRYDTAVAIANALGNPASVFEVTGLNFPDALSAGAAAVLFPQKGVILLTNGTSQSAQTAAYLAAHATGNRFAIGGPAAAADPGAHAIVGSDRFETSTMVADEFVQNPSIVGTARGDLFPDALDGGAQISESGGPIILTRPALPIPPQVSSYFSSHLTTIAQGLTYGGTDAVQPSVFDGIVGTILNAIKTLLGTI